MKSICVFCGSSPGARLEYASSARQLGKLLAERGFTLVYGGGNVGMMGQLANAVLENGGQVTGIIPEAIADMEVAHTGLSDLRVVDSMHTRKALMAELADGFIALPGGWGTLEEFVEVLTWAQLGFHAKPCGLLNVVGYYDSLLEFINQTADQQFIQPEHRELILVEENPAALLDRMTAYVAPQLDKAAWALSLNGPPN
ncbi:MAG: Lysine decarboxylase family [Olavius algarvensis Delta 4 endosymbiont]|nr:MAG: Lysine decarboxylase family [Olavius algarvensis Delta 4 endosymbiont]